MYLSGSIRDIVGWLAQVSARFISPMGKYFTPLQLWIFRFGDFLQRRVLNGDIGDSAL